MLVLEVKLSIKLKIKRLQMKKGTKKLSIGKKEQDDQEEQKQKVPSVPK